MMMPSNCKNIYYFYILIMHEFGKLGFGRFEQILPWILYMEINKNDEIETISLLYNNKVIKRNIKISIKKNLERIILIEKCRRLKYIIYKSNNNEIKYLDVFMINYLNISHINNFPIITSIFQNVNLKYLNMGKLNINLYAFNCNNYTCIKTMIHKDIYTKKYKYIPILKSYIL